MGELKKHVNHTGASRKKNAPDFSFFLSNTTFSTDVLQHEYIIYIFYTYIFQIRSEIHNGMLQSKIFWAVIQ